MTTTAFGDAPAAARAAGDADRRTPRDVAELVRQCSRLDGRHGFRVVARGVSGHIFFDGGRVIHAEFGEDVGLRAVVEMLRVGSVLLEPAASWPAQASLHLGPELLLSLTSKDASRVVRKVDIPIEPPPLPDPQADERARAAARAVAPAHPEASRAARRAVSGVMPRLPEPIPCEPKATRSSEAGEPATAARRAVQAPRLPEPPRPPASPVLSARPSELPVKRAQKAKSRSVVVARAGSPPAATHPRPSSKQAPPADTSAAAGSSAAGSSAAMSSARPGPVSPAGRTHRGALTSEPPPRQPMQAPRGQQPTTMVRIAARGDLLAARGEYAEQLAQAAAFIHGLANLIAADFGRQGRANVHLSGHGVSLLVARSEVNDIAAALGPTERMSPLLNKVGMK